MADRKSLAVAIGMGCLGALLPACAAPSWLSPATLGGGEDLYLEVFIDSRSSNVIAAFRREADGRLTVDPDELREAGLEAAPDALDKDGRIDIARLPGVSCQYDEAAQAMRCTAPPEARSVRRLDGQPRQDAPQIDQPQGLGALVNYTLFAAAGRAARWRFEGVSGFVEGRIFSPWGTFSTTAIGETWHDTRLTRLDTAWTYSDPSGPTTWRAGDLITGGFAWTRPVRLGGVQFRRSFDIRPDLVTTPLADLRGGADVPSAVEVYVDDVRRVAADVPAGPFEIVNLPLVTGANTARVVVRDALGRETVSERSVFVAPDMLAEGLFDFSIELGAARRDYGAPGDSYDRRIMASASARYGVSDGLTIAAHAEGGGGLANGGLAASASLGPYAAGSLSGSASRFGDDSGFLVSATFEMLWRDVHFYARTQRSYGDYQDIASVTADAPRPFANRFGYASPPRALDQIAVSVPGPFAGGTLNASYTRLDDAQDGRSRLLGASFSQPLFEDSFFFASAYKDLQGGHFGLFAGLTFTLGDDLSATLSGSTTGDHSQLVADVIRAEKNEIGDFAWRVQGSAGGRNIQAASASYRAPFARIEGSVSHGDDGTRATAQMDGAIVFEAGDVFFANRIDDAFAVVDTGMPGVGVELENRAAGTTDSNGRLLVSGLGAYRPNRLSIDAAGLPIDAIVASTSRSVTPADRSGAVVRFDVDTGTRAALVSFRSALGAFIETGSTGRLEGAGADFVVGYDGEAFVTGLGAANRVTITAPDGGICVGEFRYAPRAGEQVRVADVPCRPPAGGGT